jgi:hypothetical protein
LAGILDHPVAHLGVQVGEVADLAQRQKAVLDVLHARFHDAFLVGRELHAMPMIGHP